MGRAAEDSDRGVLRLARGECLDDPLSATLNRDALRSQVNDAQRSTSKIDWQSDGQPDLVANYPPQD